jgi:CubicO group peptidase (beta-lactamase class C family)
VGLAVIVSCEGDFLEEYYGGMQNIDLQLPLSPDSKYRVASVSKSFTAAGLLKLYDEGQFQLDDDISEALGYEVRNPDFPNTPITYRMLLSHTSSLQDGSGYSPFLSATYNASPLPDISEVLLEGGAYFTPNMWRLEEPGSYFAYSNINYGLIGTLIETHSGQRFDVFMRENILEPLDISGSYNILDLPDINDLTVLYRDAVAQVDDFGGTYPDPLVEDYEPGTNGSLFAPQGGLRCSAAELMRFAHMLLDEGTYNGTEILSEETVDLMLSEQWNYNGANGDNYFGLFRNWGLGVHRAEGIPGLDKVFENTLAIGHPGEAYGLISDLYIEPESELALAFVSTGYYSGGGYAFAENSIYYAPEEEAFEAIEETYLNYCTVLTTNEGSRENKCYELSSGKIAGDEIRIYDLSGRLIQDERKIFDLTEIPKGLYVIEVKTGTQLCRSKIGIQ